MLYDSYVKKLALLGSDFLLVITSTAPYILMLAVLLQQIFHFSFVLSVITGTLFSIIYVFWGGFRSVVQTDKLQFVLMFAGFAVLFYYLLHGSPALTDLPNHLDAGHRSLSGGLPWQQIVVWFLIASWTFIDPGFHQRCAAAKTPQIARKGILISIAFWFVFDMLTLVSGLYGFALYPDIQPLNAYPYLAQQLLPPIWRGLFFTGLLAIIMSTIDSYTFLSALTFGRDMVWRIKNKTALNINIRRGLGLTAIISITLIFALPSVIRMWYNLGSLFIPPLLLPLLSAYFPSWRLSASRTFFIMISAFSLSLIWLLSGIWNGSPETPQFWFGAEPFFPGLVWSGLFYFFHTKLKRNKQ
jgi:SSS family solute:Na+ symporter